MDLKTNEDLFNIVNKNKKLWKYGELYDTIASTMDRILSEDKQKILKECLRKFCVNLFRRWKKCCYNKKRFLIREHAWLHSIFNWPMGLKNEIFGETIRPQQNSTEFKRRPFLELSYRQKKRRTNALRSENTLDELIFATRLKMGTHGSRELAKILNHLLKHSEDISKVSNILFQKKKKKPTLTPDDSLALYTSLNLSKWQYNTLRDSVGKSLIPSYYKVTMAKKACYPPLESMNVTDTAAKIKIQALLDLTVSRLLKTCLDKLQSTELVLISKWGFDGASSQSNYKQTFNDVDADDSFIFMSSCVPLKLSTPNDVVFQDTVSNLH
nr:uncharacterized protein LOC111427060 [Onthophagus taurus]